jgi:HK97 family phage major capsid protein
MALSTATAPELTAEQVQRILVLPLQAASVFLSSGVRIFDTDGSPVRIPTLVGMDAPSWTGENELIPEVGADFGEITLLPSGMKSVKSLTRFSNELARQSVIALDAALTARMVQDVAAKLDAAFFAGTGGTVPGTEPTGMLAWPGTTGILDVGTLTLDDLLDAVGQAMASNVDISACKWFMRSSTFIELRKLKDAQEKYLLQPDPTLDGVFRLFGIPVLVTNRIPEASGTPNTTSVVLADMSKVAVARDVAPSVKILTERYADYDQLAVRVVSRYDVAPMLPSAVVVLRGVTA